MELISDENINLNICPECKGQIITIQDTGEVVCSQCGLVLKERIIDFSHSGKRAFTAQEKKIRERTGSPISILLPDMGLTTVIDKKNIVNPDLKRAAKWNSRISWEKRNLLIATTELKRICSNLNLPDYIKLEAISLYKKAFKRKLLRGRSINGMVAACIYYACREKRIPRTLQEILDETSISAKDVRRFYRTLIKEFNLKTPSTDPIALIPRFITELGLDSEIEGLTIKILNAYKSNISMSGKDPKGIVAGVLYLACKIRKINLTQKRIADTVGVTEVTLRSRYKELIKKLNVSI
jgi:transcription initiation factor TFIIB